MPDIYMLWGVRKDNDTPELMEAWDEYSVDGNYEGWEAAKAAAIESWGDDLRRAEVCSTYIDYDILSRILNVKHYEVHSEPVQKVSDG